MDRPATRSASRPWRPERGWTAVPLRCPRGAADSSPCGHWTRRTCQDEPNLRIDANHDLAAGCTGGGSSTYQWSLGAVAVGCTSSSPTDGFIAALVAPSTQAGLCSYRAVFRVAGALRCRGDLLWLWGAMPLDVNLEVSARRRRGAPRRRAGVGVRLVRLSAGP